MKRNLILPVTLLWLLAGQSLVYARGGGGCVEGGTLILTPAGSIAVEQLKPGDKVISLSGSASAESKVQDLYSVKPDYYYELTLEGRILRVTKEHPVAIDSGTYRMAGVLKAGDKVYIGEDNEIRDVAIQSIKNVPAATSAYNLLVSPGGTYFANGVVVHNKGCFLPDTLIRKEDGSAVPISNIRPGDRLMAFTASGELTIATVQEVITHNVNEYCIVRTEKNIVRVTAEHPFYVGDGTFKTLEVLKAGDNIFAFDGENLSSQRIESIKKITANTKVYNLQTDKPNTFFANGVAVHNKGGGGCFPAGVLIGTSEGHIPIEKIRPGDRVTAITGNGRIVSAIVRETHRTKDYVISIWAGSKCLRTTAEHPICMFSGGFCVAGKLKPGDGILLYSDNKVIPAKIDNRVSAVSTQQEEVYNLTVGWPHTFIADGVVVHNKGGGFGGGHSHRGGRSGKADPLSVVLFILVWFVFILIWLIQKFRGSGGEDENLDFVYSRSVIERKSGKTLKLLEFLSRQDPTIAPEALRKQAEITFLKLQECWQARNYEPMKALMMPDIYRNHCVQLQGMIRNREINVIADLHIDCIDLVNVRYTFKENQREFTALITAKARDYYIDDRKNAFLRGDGKIEQFQEFWTFQYFDKTWLLREIEQTRESDVLKDENFFEQFTDTGVKQIYGPEASKEGEVGPWLGKNVQTREVRIERMLNFLVQTDKIWNRQLMLETTRRVFLAVMTAWESGNEADVPEKEIFPDVAADLRERNKRNRENRVTIEFRNLCCRKAELILIQNYADKAKDEFIARIRAHAQRVVRRNGVILRQDEYVTPFEQYITMGRLDNQWKLKEILSASAGLSALGRENLDEESTPQQVQWYYQHTRAV
ncbi:MAG: TIM44-like domain-containing protein [Sedimentisphaerales bacterium]|nr:TIM44-like domain-containing protein [Sedimentisphaerales bacterium]